MKKANSGTNSINLTLKRSRHIEVVNIQCNKVPVKCAYCGQSCTIEIKLGIDFYVNIH